MRVSASEVQEKMYEGEKERSFPFAHIIRPKAKEFDFSGSGFMYVGEKSRNPGSDNVVCGQGANIAAETGFLETCGKRCAGFFLFLRREVDFAAFGLNSVFFQSP